MSGDSGWGGVVCLLANKEINNELILMNNGVFQESEGVSPPWHGYLSDGMRHLSSTDDTEQDFVRPSTDTDKLYMDLGERGVIEVAHPSDDTRSAQHSALSIISIPSFKVHSTIRP